MVAELLSCLPEELVRELLLRGDVIHLLRLRQQGDSPMTNILYSGVFWEEYCRGRGWSQLVIRKKEISWEWLALIYATTFLVQEKVEGRQGEYHDGYLDTINALRAILADLLPKPCVEECVEYASRFVFHFKNVVMLHDEFSMRLFLSYPSIIRRENLPHPDNHTPPTPASSVDIRASRNALKQMYEQDNKRLLQNKSGWNNYRKL